MTPTTVTTTAPMTLYQRYEIDLVAGWNATVKTTMMPAMSPMNAPWPFAALHRERQDEHAEDRSVEHRSERVHDLDERPEVRGVHATPQAKSPQNAVASFENFR